MDATFSVLQVTIDAGSVDAAPSVPQVTTSGDASFLDYAIVSTPQIVTAGEMFTGEIFASVEVPRVDVSSQLISEGDASVTADLPQVTVAAETNATDIVVPQVALSAELLSENLLSASLVVPRVETFGTLVEQFSSSADLVVPQVVAVAELLPGRIYDVAADLPRVAVTATLSSDNLLFAAITLPHVLTAGELSPPQSIDVSVVVPAPVVTGVFVLPVGSVSRTWVMNTSTFVITEYTGWNFNSFVEFGGGMIAAGPGGVFEVGGTHGKDDAAEITAHVETGDHDLGTTLTKNVDRVYLRGTFDGDMEVHTVVSGERRKYLAQSSKDGTLGQRVAKLGHKPRSPHWRFAATNRGGADFSLDGVVVTPHSTGRRAT